MATHTITSDTNIDDIDWDDNDDFSIYSGATLTINTSQNGDKKPGSVIVNDGTLRIENSSDDKGIVIDFRKYTFIQVKSLGKLEIAGKLIEIHESDGSDNQKFNFWNDNNDNAYAYDVPAIFVDGEHGIAMNEYYGNSDIDIDNKVVRYYSYDSDNAEFTLDHYVPADGTKIYAPNIIIKRYDDNTTGTGAQNGYIQLDTSKNATIKGAYLICNLLTSYTMDVSVEDTILGWNAYFKKITNLTISNFIAVAYNNYVAGYTRMCENVTYNKTDFFCGFNFELSKQVELNDIYVSPPRKKDQGTVYLTNCEEFNINDIKFIYSEFKEIKNSKNIKVNNPFYHFDDDYNYSGVGLVKTTGSQDVVIDNLSVCENFDYNKAYFIDFNAGSFRCKLTNSEIDVGHQEDNSHYSSIVQMTFCERCGVYNSKLKNADNDDYYGLVIYEGVKNCFVVNTDIGHRKVKAMGENNTIKKLGCGDGKFYPNEIDGYLISHLDEIDDDGNVTHKIKVFGGRDNYSMEINGDHITTDMINYRIFFNGKDESVIFKSLKEQNFRKLKSITSHSISGSNTDKIDFYLSFNGTDWIAEDDWDGTDFPSDDDFYLWFKFVTNDDGSCYVSEIEFDCDEDDNKPDYEPYFYWSAINFTNLPDEMNIGLMVGNLPPVLLSNISQNYTHWQLWRESADNVMVRVRKYGYSFYDSQGIFNDTKLDFFYTGYQKNDITMSRDDALNVDSVELKDSDDDDYAYELDCGNNNLEDVYHYIQAKLTYHNSDLNGLMSFECNEFLQRDGDKFKTIQVREGEGVKLTNYKGKASKFTKDNGDEYVVPETYIFKLTGIVEGSEVRIYKKDDMSELDGVENLDGTTYEYDYQYDEDTDIIAVVFNTNYKPVRLETTLSDSDSSIPIQQIYDRNYNNP